MVGGTHYPGISGLRIPNFVNFMLDMTDSPPSAVDLQLDPVESFVPCRSLLSPAACAALQAEFSEVTAAGPAFVADEDEHVRRVHSRGGYFSYALPTNTRLVDAVVAPSSLQQVGHARLYCVATIVLRADH